MMLYQMVELEEGVDVQYLGVYALKWQREWGPPSVGFVEQDVVGLVPVEQHEQLLQEYKALQELVAIRDSGLAKMRQIVAVLDEQSERLDILTKAAIDKLKVNLAKAEEHIEALERRVREEKAWAQHREDMYVAVRKQLRQAGVIKSHEEITVEDAIKRLLRQVADGSEEVTL